MLSSADVQVQAGEANNTDAYNSMQGRICGCYVVSGGLASGAGGAHDRTVECAWKCVAAEDWTGKPQRGHSSETDPCSTTAPSMCLNISSENGR